MLRCDLIFPATSIKSVTVSSLALEREKKRKRERGRTQRDHVVFRFLRFFVDADIWRHRERERESPSSFS